MTDEPTTSFLGFDYVSLAFQIIGAVHKKRLLAEYEILAERIVKARLKYCQKNIPISQENAVAVLRDILEDLEREMARRISRHSAYYWLHLYRRVGPWPFEEDDEATTYLYRQTLELAIIKYGKRIKKGELRVVKNEVFPKLYSGLNSELPDDPQYSHVRKLLAILSTMQIPEEGRTIIATKLNYEVLLRVYQLEALARAYYRTTQSLRNVWKGARMIVDSSTLEYSYIDPGALRKLIVQFDERMSQNPTLTREFGLVTSVVDSKSVEFSVIAPVLNTYREPLSRLFPGTRLVDDFYPNFVLGSISIKDYYEKLVIFRPQVTQLHKFTPEQIVSYFIALSMYAAYRIVSSPSAYLMLLQRGYWLSEKPNDYNEVIAEIYQDVQLGHFQISLSHDEALRTVKKLTKHLTWQPISKQSISLHTREPRKLIVPTEFGMLVDFSSIPLVLASFINDLATTTDRVGELKGTSFENYVVDCLDACKAPLEYWLCHTDVQLTNGNKTDIDVSFIIAEYLFVVECKAYGFSRALDRGEADALDARRRQVSKAIKQLTRLCEHLVSGGVLGHTLPAGVKIVVPVLCLPYPYYIHRVDERYFIIDDVPRICTPQELVGFLESDMLNRIEINSYNLGSTPRS